MRRNEARVQKPLNIKEGVANCPEMISKRRGEKIDLNIIKVSFSMKTSTDTYFLV